YRESSAQRFDLLNLGKDLGRRGGILEVISASQDAGRIGAANNDVDSLCLASGHQPLQSSRVIQKRVSAGQEKGVRPNLRHIDEQFARLDLVDAESPTLD